MKIDDDVLIDTEFQNIQNEIITLDILSDVEKFEVCSLVQRVRFAQQRTPPGV